MNKNLMMRNKNTFKANARIIQTTIDGKLVRDIAVKNIVCKTYGLYSYVRFILGSFNNGTLWDYKQYVPKYLAVGSDSGDLNGAPGTETAAQITDISLYHELNDSEVTGEPYENNRIKLNRANYVEDNENENWIKVQYEAYIPENRFVGETIGEAALMTMQIGWNAFARVTFPAFIKEPNTVIQVIWEITVISVESSTRFLPPVKTTLREAVEKAIDVLCDFPEDPEGLVGARTTLNKMIQPATKDNTGLYYLLTNNEIITQEVINSYLSAPFNSLEDTGLIALINKFDPDWYPSTPIVS